MYTVKEFRSNLRKAFNEAREGHEVVIDKWGDKFQLVCLVDEPIGGSSFEAGVGEPKLKTTDRFGELKDMAPKNKVGITGTVLEAPASSERDQFIPTSPAKDWPPKRGEPIHTETKDYSLCKHGNIKGFCKLGCK